MRLFLSSIFLCIFIYLPHFWRYQGNVGINAGINEERLSCLKELPSIPKDLPIFPPGKGFDSGDYFLIANDPFLKTIKKCGGNVEYNAQRYLYHLVIWILSFGQSHLISWAGIFLNILSLSLTVLVWDKILKIFLIPSWVVWPVVFHPGVWFGFRFNSTENFLFLLMSLLLFLHFTHRKWMSLIVSSFAIITRNVSMGMNLSITASELIKDKKISIFSLLNILIPVAVYKWGLMSFLKSSFSNTEIASGFNFFTLPLKKPILESLSYYTSGEYLRFSLVMATILYLLILLLICMRYLLKNGLENFELVCMVMGYVLVLLSIENSGWGNGPLHTIRVIPIVIPVSIILLFHSVNKKIFNQFLILTSIFSLWGPIWLWFSPLIKTQALSAFLLSGGP